MNKPDYTNNPEKYPYNAVNKKTREDVVYRVITKRNGDRVYKVIVPSAGGIVTYNQLDFEHYFKRVTQ